jgi:hypothetical protein
MLVAGLFCLGAAWLAGPVPRFWAALLIGLLLPGYLLARATLPTSPPLLIRMLLWIGLSLTLIALLYQIAWITGIALTTPVLFGLLLAVLGGAVWLAWHDLGHTVDLPQIPGVWWLFGLICLLTLALRFVQISSVDLPPWVDPIHHTLMVRVAAERGMAPVDLTPYMAVTALPYHWGYHVQIATAYRLSGLDLIPTMLWSGQLLNALQAPAAGALALLLWRQPSAAVIAALIVGLVSIFPAYYVSWGRYTQLTGFLLMPGLAAAWAYALAQIPHQGRVPWRWWALAALLLAGLSLIHFRVLIFALGLIAVQSVLWALDRSWAQIGRAVAAVLLTGLSALVLAGPWFALLFGQLIAPALERPANLVGEANYADLNTGLLWSGLNPLLVALALLAAAWLIRQQRRATLLMIGWVLLLFSFANPQLLTYILPAVGFPLLLRGLLERDPRWLTAGAVLLLINPRLVQLPASWLINNEAVIISLFWPISLLIAGAAAGLFQRLQHLPARWRPFLTPLAIATTLAVALWGGWNMRDVINRATVFATAADLRAIAWIDANTTPEARFLINTTPWLGISHRGVDGGWWLLPLIGRWTSTPPALFVYEPMELIEATRERTQIIQNFRPGMEASIEQVIARDGIDYLYFGPHTGPLRPEYFRDRPGMRIVYDAEGITILAVGS